MSIPLSLRIGDRNITRRVDDLTFRKTVNGTAEISFNLADALDAEFPPFENVYVYDGTSADVIADGKLEEPGRTLDDQGQRWDMSAIGNVARAADRAAALIYIDTDLSRWLRVHLSRATSGDASATDLPTVTGIDALLMQYNPGQPIDDFSSVDMAYNAIAEAGMQVGGIEYMAVAGISSASFEFRMFAGPSNTQVRNDAWSTTDVSRFATQGGTTPLPAGTTSVELRAPRVSGGATNVASDDRWAAFYAVVVKAARFNLDGTLNTTQTDYAAGRMVYPHEVVTDVLVRMLSSVYDTTTAVIDTSSTYPIDQLAYPDGVTAEQLLADLTEIVPDFYWQVGPPGVNGKASFTWRQWPTGIRYTISLRDGVSLPGTDSERYNRVTVRWVDKRGRSNTSTYDAGTTINGIVVPVVAELETAGPGQTRLVRQPEIQDLADEIGSQAAADKFAAEFLLEHGTPPAAGTLTVGHKVWDGDRGVYVQPWELEPGHLCFVPELADCAEDYSTDGRNGKSVFRIVGMTYTASDNQAQLELDSPPRTDENLLAEQVSKRERKR